MFAHWKTAPRLAVRLGSFSYTLYLFHFPLLVAAFSVLIAVCGAQSPSVAARLGLSIGCFVLILAVSAASGAFLENSARIRGLFRTTAVKQAA